MPRPSKRHDPTLQLGSRKDRKKLHIHAYPFSAAPGLQPFAAATVPVLPTAAHRPMQPSRRSPAIVPGPPLW
jgi:hypothetical protein